MLGDLLGFAIILGSFSVKIPLIQNCIAVKSTAGLPESGLLLEIAGFLIAICYNARKGFPISTWGELLTICGQDFVLLGVMWYYNKALVTNVLKTIAQGLALVAFMFVVPGSILPIMPLLGMFVGWSSLVPQIMANFKQKHTGPLSLTSQSIVVFGGFIRLYTVLTQVDDFVSQFGVIVGTSLQTIMLIQIIALKKNTEIVMEKLRRGETIEKPAFSEEETSPLAVVTETELFQKMINSKEMVQALDALKATSEALTETRETVTNELVKAQDSLNEFRNTNSYYAKFVESMPFPEVLKEMDTFDVIVDKAYENSEEYLDLVTDFKDNAQRGLTDSVANARIAFKEALQAEEENQMIREMRRKLQ